jgi:hypothetical protein
MYATIGHDIGWLFSSHSNTFSTRIFQELLIHHLMEDVGGDETIAQYFLLPLCPHGVHLFASSHCPVDP